MAWAGSEGPSQWSPPGGPRMQRHLTCPECKYGAAGSPARHSGLAQLVALPTSWGHWL